MKIILITEDLESKIIYPEGVLEAYICQNLKLFVIKKVKILKTEVKK